MRTTIRDIANYTGLSITTVSLVLNNKPSKIPERTKRKVFEAAEQLNYSPNYLAVGLVTKSTKIIGLITTDVSNTFYGILAKGVEKACQELGWSVMLCNSWDSHERDMELIRVLANKSVDGIIYCMSSDSDRKKAEESFQLLKKNKIPCIMIDNDFGGMMKHNVFFDNEMGGYLATEHLIKNGHRRIACITGPRGVDEWQKGRIQGYKRALSEASITYDPDIMAEGDYTMESGIEAVEKLKNKEITGIFAFNDMMAFGAFKALKNAGINVPEDISLVGYDDIPFCEILEVPLTTVKQPVYEMGHSAAENMIKIIKTGVEKKLNLKFSPILIDRKSVKNIKR